MSRLYFSNTQFVEIHNYCNKEGNHVVIDPVDRRGYYVNQNWKVARCPDHKTIMTFDFNEMGFMCSKCGGV